MSVNEKILHDDIYGEDGLTERQRYVRKIPAELLRWLQEQHALSYGEAKGILTHALTLLDTVMNNELHHLPMASGIDEDNFTLVMLQTTTERLIAEAHLNREPE